jgi:hypothetical protein
MKTITLGEREIREAVTIREAIDAVRGGVLPELEERGDAGVGRSGPTAPESRPSSRQSVACYG